MSEERRGRSRGAFALDRFLQSETGRKVQPFIVAALLMFCFVNFPSQPLTTGTESWSHVMLLARERGLRFGHDVIYTYGPSAFLFMAYFPEHTPAIRLICDVVGAYTVALGVCLLAWRMNLIWRLVFLGVFIVSPTTWFTLGIPELLFMFGVFCWGLLARNVCWAMWVLIPLAALLALAKVSFLIVGSVTVLALAVDRRSAVPVLGYGVALLGFWLLLGQRLWDIWSFVRVSLNMSGGYDSAMVLQPYPLILCLGVLALAVLAATAWKAQLSISYKVWFALLLFCVWKASFVRSEVRHQQVFFGFIPLCAIVLAATDFASKHRRFSQLMAVVSLVVSVGTLFLIEPGWTQQDELLVNRVTENVQLLAEPGDYYDVTKQRVDAEKDKAQLPAISGAVSNAPVDLFGWDLAYATFNGLDFTPRPCCQSYAAYTPLLARLNGEFYRTNAPQFVLFQLKPTIDNRFPPSEDPFVLRDLALNYEPCSSEGEFELLKKARDQTFRLIPVSVSNRAANEAQPIPAASEPLWCEVACARQPIRRLFYSESLLTVKATRGNESHEYSLARPLLSTGFLVNPLLLTTADIRDAKAAGDIPCSLAISERVQYRFYRLLPEMARPEISSQREQRRASVQGKRKLAVDGPAAHRT